MSRGALGAGPAGGAARAGRPVRVAYCLDSLGVGGTETNALRTIERLDRARVEPLLAYGEDGPLSARFAAAVAVRRRAPLAGFARPSFPGAVWRLARFFRDARADVVHSHDVYDNVFAGLAARVAGVPFVASRRWGLAQYSPKLTRLNRHVGYRLARRVLANSAGVGRSVVEDEGVPASRVAVVPNFVDPALFAPADAAERAALRDALGVPRGALVVGTVARLDPVKDPLTLVRALAALPAGLAHARLVFVGDGERRAAVEALAVELGVAQRVVLAGTRPDGARWHRAFDVSALASLSEGFPNSLVEAAAAGRAVVATRVGGVPDVVDDGETGLLVPAGEPPRVAAALGELLGDPARREAMGGRARERARARFDERVVLPGLYRLYDELVGRPPA